MHIYIYIYITIYSLSIVECDIPIHSHGRLDRASWRLVLLNLITLPVRYVILVIYLWWHHSPVVVFCSWASGMNTENRGHPILKDDHHVFSEMMSNGPWPQMHQIASWITGSPVDNPMLPITGYLEWQKDFGSQWRPYWKNDSWPLAKMNLPRAFPPAVWNEYWICVYICIVQKDAFMWMYYIYIYIVYICLFLCMCKCWISLYIIPMILVSWLMHCYFFGGGGWVKTC